MRRLTRHPLARALRVDKLTLAALEATLTGPVPPVAAALAADPASLLDRAERIVAACNRSPTSTRGWFQPRAAVGGGGAPGVELPSAAISLPEALAVPLRCGSPPVVGRLEAGRLLLDLRSRAPRAGRAPRALPSSRVRAGDFFMIVNSLCQIRPISGHDHGCGGHPCR